MDGGNLQGTADRHINQPPGACSAVKERKVRPAACSVGRAEGEVANGFTSDLVPCSSSNVEDCLTKGVVGCDRAGAAAGTTQNMVGGGGSHAAKTADANPSWISKPEAISYGTEESRIGKRGSGMVGQGVDPGSCSRGCR